MATFSFDKVTQLITVAAPTTVVTVQEIINAARDWQDELTNIEVSNLITASGKEDLGGGVLVGITIKLLNWKLKFEDRPGPVTILCDVTGGNLVAVDANGIGINPIEPSTFVTVTKTSSSSATISELEIFNLQRLIETSRPHHTGTGNIWYWDPINGEDVFDGKRPSKAVKTFAQAHNLVVNNNHDIIMCVPGDPSGVTVTNEVINISKNYLFVRGPGRNFRIIPTSLTQDAITITGDGVEVSSMVIRSPIGNPGYAINILSKYPLIKDIWIINGSRGVSISDSSYAILDRCVIHHVDSHAVVVRGTSMHTDITNCNIESRNGDGIRVELAAGAQDVNILGETNIHGCGMFGLNIISGEGVNIAPSVRFYDNHLGDIFDGGVKTQRQDTSGTLVALRDRGDEAWVTGRAGGRGFNL